MMSFSKPMVSSSRRLMSTVARAAAAAAARRPTPAVTASRQQQINPYLGSSAFYSKVTGKTEGQKENEESFKYKVKKLASSPIFVTLVFMAFFHVAWRSFQDSEIMEGEGSRYPHHHIPEIVAAYKNKDGAPAKAK